MTAAPHFGQGTRRYAAATAKACVSVIVLLLTYTVVGLSVLAKAAFCLVGSLAYLACSACEDGYLGTRRLAEDWLDGVIRLCDWMDSFDAATVGSTPATPTNPEKTS